MSLPTTKTQDISSPTVMAGARLESSARQSPRWRRHRRLVRIGILLVVIALLFLGVRYQDQSLWHSAYMTGYLLLGALFFLASYNLRKAIPFLPALGSSRAWMQLHIYVGLGTIALFMFHVSWRIPTGRLEQFLAGLYFLVAGSGVYGLIITRLIPKKLTALRNEVIFEQIPAKRRELVARARQVILESAKSTDVLAKFYTNHLFHYLETPRSWRYAVAPSSRYCKKLLSEIRGLNRYLSVEQRHFGEQLLEIVETKEDLDFHYVMQGRLKLWLFAHIGMTYGLLITAVLHGVLAHAFGGGLR